MFIRFILAFVAIFFIFQVIYASPSRVPRDTGSDTGKSIDDAINAFTQNLETIMKNIQPASELQHQELARNSKSRRPRTNSFISLLLFILIFPTPNALTII